VPGGSPYHAVAAFLAPIQQAVSCLGPCKVTVSSNGRNPRVGQGCAWSLNDGAGIELRTSAHAAQRLLFDAAMYWVVIEDAREGYGPYRVSTLGYDYSMSWADGREMWAMHWHPKRVSEEQRPHVHLAPALLSKEAPDLEHLVTPRMTFKNAVRWAIEFGATPAVDDWDSRLTLAETPHLLYRSWHQDPAEGKPSP
jgi:hypothetical protein